jgi:hypothetical protein
MTVRDDTVLVRLSDFDRRSIDTSSVLAGYVLKPEAPFDAQAVDATMRRVAEKWRLLAGRIEWDKQVSMASSAYFVRLCSPSPTSTPPQDGVWAIRVPLGPLPPSYKTHNFTTSISTSPLNVPSPTLTASSATVLHRPSLTPFVSPSTLSSNADFAKRQEPIIAIHVSVLSDCTCIGLSFPHGVFDATGMGEVIHALDAELNGKEWTAPALEEVNLVAKAFKEHEGMETDESELPPVLRDLAAGTWREMARLFSSFAYEYFWHRAKTCSVFLGEEVVKRIVEKVKEEALEESGGEQWVTTGDVLTAWVLKVSQLSSVHLQLEFVTQGRLHCRPRISTNPRGPTPSPRPHYSRCDPFSPGPPPPLLSPTTPIIASSHFPSQHSLSSPSRPPPSRLSPFSTVAPSTPLARSPTSTQPTRPATPSDPTSFPLAVTEPIRGSLRTKSSEAWRRLTGARGRRRFGFGVGR